MLCHAQLHFSVVALRRAVLRLIVLSCAALWCAVCYALGLAVGYAVGFAVGVAVGFALGYAVVCCVVLSHAMRC